MRRILGIAFGLCVVASTASATTIVINPGAGLIANPTALTAFNNAATTLGNMFADQIQVTIAANLANLGSPNIIGQTSSVVLSGTFNTVRNAMVADAADEPRDAIVASLPTAAQVSVFLPTGFGLANAVLTTKANFKALGFAGLDQAFGATDATITFNSTFAFDFDRSNGITPGQIDFETVALHELIHALGFVSSVDSIDFALSQGATGNVQMTALDLFRFRDVDLPTNAAQFTTTPRSLVPSVPSSFSDTLVAVPVSTGVSTGDGRQASHWKDNNLTGVLLGIMDPTLASGVSISISANDLRALDLIGWDPVPEPATFMLLGSGLLVVAWRRHRTRRI